MKKIIIWNFFFILFFAACKSDGMTEEQKLQKRYEKTTDSLIKSSGIKPDTTKISKEEMIKRIQ